jgi:hypothetical protein
MSDLTNFKMDVLHGPRKLNILRHAPAAPSKKWRLVSSGAGSCFVCGLAHVHAAVLRLPGECMHVCSRLFPAAEPSRSPACIQLSQAAIIARYCAYSWISGFGFPSTEIMVNMVPLFRSIYGPGLYCKRNASGDDGKTACIYPASKLRVVTLGP